LIERLDEGAKGKLVLVSAPAGYGKTTLVSVWAQQTERPVAWLSLDKGDNHLVTFLSYFVAAVQQIDERSCLDIQTALQSAQPPQPEIFHTLLVNEIDAMDIDFVLVLDDYHVIQSTEIHSTLDFLLNHSPPRFHLVIASRDDPFLPLSRLRARGHMIELRASDLRFSSQEATAFFNQVMDLGLSGENLADLESRTEGWIAGLHLAALSMQGRKRDGETPTSFVSAFTGDDRYVIDYLVDEVLSQRPEGTKDFLLKTSILDRMTGTLCEAVTGQKEGQKVLHQLEQANLFIIPLDNQRYWYRYHQLFTDLLRQRLEESHSPLEIKSLHLRASQWHEGNGLLVQAVEHALAAEDYQNAIRLIVLGSGDLFRRSQLNILARWWDQLPREVVGEHPTLCMLNAWAWLATGFPEKAENCLQLVEQKIGLGMGALYAEREGTMILSPEDRGALVEIAVVRAQLAITHGDIPKTSQLTNLVLPYLEDEDLLHIHNPPKETRSVVLFTMGVVHKLRGELREACDALSKTSVLAQERGNVHLTATAYGHLVGVLGALGDLDQAVQICKRGLTLIQEMAGERSPLSGLMYAELGNVLHEKNELEPALSNLQESIAVAKPWGILETLLPGYAGLARARAAQGDWEGAFAALDELAEYGLNKPQAVNPVVELTRAKLWVAQGKVDAAQRWLHAVGIEKDGEINFYNQENFILLARILVVQKEWDQAAELLDRVLKVTEAGNRRGSLIELLILKTLIHHGQGNQDQAVESLGRALAIAEPEGYKRLFLDEGEPMEALLHRASTQHISEEFIRELLTTFEAEAPEGADHSALQVKGKSPPPSLVDPLTERELEVLRLLKTQLSGPEIARELTIALSTLRTHTQGIYSKLNVSNRRAAISKAEELGLI
jgi:LuxR family maltose regulon positive regulatory protein